MKRIVVLVVGFLAVVNVFAEVLDKNRILERLQTARPDFQFNDIEPTAVKGIYKTSIKRGPVIYITEDGKHFFAGDFFEINPDGIVNIAERDMEMDRARDLSALSDDDMIVFAAKDKKAHLYVFTDADCYYCQKLHNEIDEITAKGIEVRYLAYPRAGIGSESYKKIASAWCAKDPNDALTKIKAGQSIPENVCDDNPVKAQYDLGGKLGVTGTPALVTSSGKLIAGYLPADKLAERLGL